MFKLNARIPLRSRLTRPLICTASLLFIGGLISKPAWSHPTLVIESIEVFEKQTNVLNTHTTINTIALIDTLTIEQTLANEPVFQEAGLTNTTPQAESDTALEPPKAVVASDIWDRIRAGFAMEDLEHPSVNHFERRYCKNPELMTEMMHHAEKYLFHVAQAIEDHNMPMELALLPLVESRYNPTARSGASAAGLWQIMPRTGKHLGLKQDWWVDERYDITASTTAALNYLNRFYERFEDWPLALAAYNAGAGTVSRAIKQNKTKGRATDYLHLKLPKETKNYLPKLQAIKNIVSNPALYGIDIKPIDDKPYFTSVSLPEQIDKALLSTLADISKEELDALNPELKRPLITHETTQDIHLPVEAAERFEANLSIYDKPLVSWQAYTLPAGERLSRVAKQFGIPAKTLGKLNQVSTHRRHRHPISILVPNAKSLTTRAENGNTTTKIFTEDMLIAQQTSSNLTPASLKALNKNNKLLFKPPRKRQRTYVVKRGDTLSEIAKRYHLSWKKLQRLNHLKNRLLKAGQRIKLY